MKISTFAVLPPVGVRKFMNGALSVDETKVVGTGTGNKVGIWGTV